MYEIFREQIKKIIFKKSGLGSFLLSAGSGQSSEVGHVVELVAHNFTPEEPAFLVLAWGPQL